MCAARAEIYDGFKDLDPAVRSESMARILSQFGERMRDNNKRILSRVLDLIADTEGDDELHLNMLATHLAKETTEVLDLKTWPGDNEAYRRVTRLRDFMPQTGAGSETGLAPWQQTDDGRKINEEQIARFLQSLEEKVRRNASRELIGSAADTLELPAEYREFFNQTHGVYYPNWDREMFFCEFGSSFLGAPNQAQPLDKLVEWAAPDGFDVAAGWKAGDNDRNTKAFYLLCRDEDEPDELWQWKIFFNDIESADFRCYDNLNEFLSWYCCGYDWVYWEGVERDVGYLHEKCKNAQTEA